MLQKKYYCLLLVEEEIQLEPFIPKYVVGIDLGVKDLVTTSCGYKFKKLEKLVLENEEISLKLERLHEVEKQAVNAKELGLENTYFVYKKEYEEIIKSFEDDVLISMYLNAKEEVLSIVKLVTETIEREINKKINE